MSKRSASRRAACHAHLRLGVPALVPLSRGPVAARTDGTFQSHGEARPKRRSSHGRRRGARAGRPRLRSASNDLRRPTHGRLDHPAYEAMCARFGVKFIYPRHRTASRVGVADRPQPGAVRGSGRMARRAARLDRPRHTLRAVTPHGQVGGARAITDPANENGCGRAHPHRGPCRALRPVGAQGDRAPRHRAPRRYATCADQLRSNRRSPWPSAPAWSRRAITARVATQLHERLDARDQVQCRRTACGRVTAPRRPSAAEVPHDRSIDSRCSVRAGVHHGDRAGLELGDGLERQQDVTLELPVLAGASTIARVAAAGSSGAPRPHEWHRIAGHPRSAPRVLRATPSFDPNRLNTVAPDTPALSASSATVAPGELSRQDRAPRRPRAHALHAGEPPFRSRALSDAADAGIVTALSTLADS